MLEPKEESKILNKPEILRRESTLEPTKKKKHWLFKLILILIVVGVVYFLFTNSELITNPVNKFFGRFS